MSKFYGMIQGNRSSVTRSGSKTSGFRSSCQSWNGSIICNMYYSEDENGKEILKCRVGTNEGSGCYTDCGSNDFVGSFEEFKELLNLHNKIKSGEVKIIEKK